MIKSIIEYCIAVYPANYYQLSLIQPRLRLVSKMVYTGTALLERKKLNSIIC